MDDHTVWHIKVIHSSDSLSNGTISDIRRCPLVAASKGQCDAKECTLVYGELIDETQAGPGTV